MATANPPPPDDGEDDFALELGRVREQIKQNFTELVEYVKARECKLLEELDTIIASYHSYRDEFEKQKKDQQTIETAVNFLREDLENSPVGVRETLIKLAGDRLKSVKFPVKPEMVHLVWDNSKMLRELNTLGKLVEKVRGSIHYKSKFKKIQITWEKDGMKQLNSLWGMAVDNKTGNIHIADWDDRCVRVYDSSGKSVKFLMKCQYFDDNEEALYPKGLVISENMIFITNFGKNKILTDGKTLESDYSIRSYQLKREDEDEYEYERKSHKYIELDDPRGLACNEFTGDIFICEYGNNCIKILTKELEFKSQFGDDNLRHPLDVKISKSIFILDESNPCIHLYDYNLILQKSVVSRGEGMQVVNPYYLFIDDSNNVLISDNGSDSINIFNHEFELIHKMNTSTHPMGVVVDNQERVLVVCRADEDCLQIF